MAVAVTTAAVVAAGLASTTNAVAAPATAKLTPGVSTSSLKDAGATAARLGLPKSGSYGFLLTLDTKSTGSVQRSMLAKGASVARAAAKAQGSRVVTAQNAVKAELPANSAVLYKTSALVAGLAVRTDVKNYKALTKLDGVTAVYPITPKKQSNAYAVPFQGGAQAWTTYGDRGENSTIAIIDTGIDYTHTDFGGAGTQAAFDEAKSAAQQTDPTVFPTSKVIGGYDLAGDDYNADPTSAGYQPVPHPDANPLDCNGHGSHVAGTAAGYGVNADGSTYTGNYNNNTPFGDLKIGPGMAPEAKLLAFRVFGCAGSTDLTGAAIERAIDPNQDGDTSDHANVANLSLGSDFAPPNDADTFLVKKATEAGVTMVIASGNNGDLYDTGGSPGVAPTALTVAASQDAAAVVDSLNVTAPAAIAGKYPAERSIAYDYSTKPDLSGDVAQVKQAGNTDGCDPLNATDAAAVYKKIAFVEWTDLGVRRCGSVGRSANLVAAGATGFIFGSDQESFSAGITGSAAIPGVLVAKSGADAIRAQLVAGTTVTIDKTVKNGAQQLDPALNDTLADFSSRGIRGVDNVKPDVTAVGATVFSAAVGTGSDGVTESGTSMATPMTAGLAGLVTSLHPEWTVEQVKADIMNTARQNLFTDANHEGKKYAPNRVGSGRIDAAQALKNKVLAYVSGTDAEKGVVSASFGPIEVTGDTTLTKTIKVQNTGLDAATYDVSYQSRTSIPGAVYSVSPATITVPGRTSGEVTLTLTLTKDQLTKTIDPTVERTTNGDPREYVADTSGLVVLDGDGVPNLRVPVYAAPRPTSTMTQAASVTLPDGAVQTAVLPLTGGRINQGDGKTNVTSLVAGFELQGQSAELPTCGGTVTTGCVKSVEEKAADLKYTGVSSSAPALNSIGENPLTSPNGLSYFAVNTWGPWRSPAGFQVFEVYIDTNGDGKADVETYNTRLPDTDVMVAQTVDLKTGKVLDVEGINDRLGDTDTALFDSDSIVLPVAISALPGVTADKSRITYSVQASTGTSGLLDSIGKVADDGTITGGSSFDVLKPGLTLNGSYNGDTSALLYPDSPGSVLQLRRDAAEYAKDQGLGALIVHFHNAVGNKSQVVSLNKEASSTSITATPNPVAFGGSTSVAVTVSGTAGTPTGTVVLKADGVQVGTGTLSGGTATISYSPTAVGTDALTVEYAGDANYAPSTSNTVSLTVTKAVTTTTLELSPTTFRIGASTNATVSVGSTAPGVPSGTVQLKIGASTVGTGTLDSTGKATIKFTSGVVGTRTMTAVYGGDSTFAGSTSNSVDFTAKAKIKPVIKVVLTPSPATVNKQIKGTVTITISEGVGATGPVTLRRTSGTPANVANGTLVNGKGSLVFVPRITGKTTFVLNYPGDANYAAGSSSPIVVTVNK